MKTSLYKYANGHWLLRPASKPVDEVLADLVICFSGKAGLTDPSLYGQLKMKFPKADIAFCSTAGEIFQQDVHDQSCVLVALQPERSEVRVASVNIKDHKDSYDAGAELAGRLKAKGLAYILILSDGSQVIGNELVKGFNAVTPDVLITGGLAGDGIEFRSTLVGLNASPEEGRIVAIGFYGDKIRVTHGSQTGWDEFGVEKLVTRSSGNVLYEIDHENALDKYIKYLGEDAAQLPGSAFSLPLAVKMPGSDTMLLRTILKIDEENDSLIFGGDVPEGSRVRFMRTNLERLTNAAGKAARCSMKGNEKPDFALVISCIGRKMMLGPRTEQEVEAVSEVLGGHVPLAGFYSYGEISPFCHSGESRFHNQTMTITSFYELP